MTTSNSTSPTSACNERACCRICPKFAYGVLLAGIAALAFTGIGTFLFGKPPMTHWVLMAHVGASPLFSIGLALVALVSPARRSESCATKFFFWLMLLCGLVVILSGVVPMTPVFGTEGQHTLYLTHRYSAIVMAVLLVPHLLTLRKSKVK